MVLRKGGRDLTTLKKNVCYIITRLCLLSRLLLMEYKSSEGKECELVSRLEIQLRESR